MKYAHFSAGRRKSVNLSLNVGVVDAAREAPLEKHRLFWWPYLMSTRRPTDIGSTAGLTCLRGLDTRFVVPLRPEDGRAGGYDRLNPAFVIAGDRFIMLTHLAAAVAVRLLHAPKTSLAAHDHEIGRALDMLIGGF